MQVQIESQDLHAALKSAMRLASPTEGAVVISVDKVFKVISHDDLNSCEITVPCKSLEGTAQFAINVDVLTSATRGRKIVSFEFKNTVLYIKSGNYKAELATTDAIQVENTSDDKSESVVKVSVDQVAWLKNSLSAVALKPNPLVSSFMPCGISFSKKGAFVGCFDTNQMAFTTSKEITGEASFTLPLDVTQTLVDVFGSSDFRFELRSSGLMVRNKMIRALMALPNLTEGIPPLDEVIEKSKSLPEMEGRIIKFDKADVLSFMDNARAIVGKERAEIAVSVTEEAAIFSAKTIVGQTKSKIKVKAKKPVKFTIDYERFDDAIRKCGTELSIRVVDNAFLLIKTEKCVLVVALNQE